MGVGGDGGVDIYRDTPVRLLGKFQFSMTNAQSVSLLSTYLVAAY